MDPDANLKEQLELAAKIVAAFDTEMGNGSPDPADVDRLAELVLALNYWITNGGFLPKVWARRIAQHAATSNTRCSNCLRDVSNMSGAELGPKPLCDTCFDGKHHVSTGPVVVVPMPTPAQVARIMAETKDIEAMREARRIAGLPTLCPVCGGTGEMKTS